MPESIRHVEHVMGTVFSFDVRSPRTPEITVALAGAVAWLHRVDRVFSTYREDSDVSRLARGEIGLADCDPDVADVLRRCGELERETGGAFSATAAGRLDPSGLVKGWAIERASAILHDAGARDHCVNGGGDIQLRGEAAPGEPWRIGLADPADPTALAAVVSGTDLAIATSGTAERGHHIVDPRTGRPAAELASLTLVGRHLTEVDALATAAFVMGGAAREWASARPGVEAFAVAPDRARWWTPGFERLALLPAAPGAPGTP
ncbi:FAD:protein FMN transferase [Actinomadura nitritigenes]|uniref:FAD:protein FMN transferase n=1 Tax=Actinomadura nitritigenes TaxID=134602 RepID=UPI003D8E3470